jgi:DNA-binding MarR family transcriptional regulator
MSPLDSRPAAGIPVPEESTLALDAEAIRSVMLRVSNLHRRHLMDTLADFSLTAAQYHILLAIRRCGEGCAMSELAEATHQVLPTTSGIVDRLSERGLAERREDPADRRSRRVYLTAEGDTLVAAVEERRQQHALAILERFSSDDRRDLLRLMDLYLAAIQADVQPLDPTAG